jgi:hypothetical protein
VVDLFDQDGNKLYAMAVNYPSIGGGIQLGYRVAAPPGGEVPAGLILQAFNALKPGLVGLVSNPAESIAITAGMAVISREFIEAMESFSSDEGLSSTLSSVLEIDENELIGMSFAEFATIYGVDAGHLKLRIVNQQLNFPSYSVTTLKLDGFSYSLSRSTSLAPDSWQTVSHTETIGAAGTITLTDPNASGSKAYYRVVLGNQFSAPAEDVSPASQE